eukprot:COSAG02_NODE_63368_length_263_cov_0.817073_1_plen_34_part_10
MVTPIVCADSGAIDDDGDPSTVCVAEVQGTVAIQ